MKILFIGHLDEGQTSLMRMRALQRLGHEVVGVNTVKPWLDASWSKRQLQRRFQVGSIIQSINRAVISAARQFKPSLVWAEKQEYLKPSTLHELRRLGARLLHFTPDPYFSLSWKRSRIMDRALPLFDILVFCKSYEQAQYEAVGPMTRYMPLGYCDEIHRPPSEPDPHWFCTVGFLGGWEPRREQLLREVARSGADLKIRGVAWEFLSDGRWSIRRHLILKQLAGDESYKIRQDPLLSQAYCGGEVYASDYAQALSGAQIGLGFLRTICPDQHTTRSFEIPACGSLLLADRTEEHQAFFEEGREADFFSSEQELIDKVEFYRRRESLRRRVSEAGMRRCHASRYAYIHRMADVLASL